MNTPRSAVQVHGLTKRYGTTTVLNNVDLTIAPGETYALLGPNGAGKSTMIETLEGFRHPSGGTVEVLGANPLTAERTWRARIGIVAQQTGDLGPYTPRELIASFGGHYPHPRGVDEVIELVGLPDDRTRVRANKLSGGMQRRLDVALGIVGRPELLFLDEPTTGFDPEARHDFWAMLERLAAEGTAILLTTHYLEEAERLADRVGVLTGGRIIAEAPPQLLGGPGARTPVVRWRSADGVWHEEKTQAPGQLIVGLAAGGIEPVGLEVRRPTLEEVYLTMIDTNKEHDHDRH
jgi:ABC-2 type transport system ATP-binding protein